MRAAPGAIGSLCVLTHLAFLTLEAYKSVNICENVLLFAGNWALITPQSFPGCQIALKRFNQAQLIML
jgi:hypothetical protein